MLLLKLLFAKKSSKLRSFLAVFVLGASLSACVTPPQPEPENTAPVATPTETRPTPPPVEQAPFSSESKIKRLNKEFNCTPAAQRPALGQQSKTLHIADNAQISSFHKVQIKPVILTYKLNRQANTLSKNDYHALQSLVRETLIEEWRLRFAWQEGTSNSVDTLSLQIWLSDLTSNTNPKSGEPVRISALLSRSDNQAVLIYSCTDALYLAAGLDGANKSRLRGSAFWQKLAVEIRRWGSELGSHIAATE